MFFKRLFFACVTCVALLFATEVGAQNYYGGLFHDGVPLHASDLNANNTAIYASINALASGSFVPLTGGTMTGPLILTTPLAPSSGGTGVDNGSTITLGGPLATVGPYALTFNTTGITNLTFPTSGTLAQNTLANVNPVIGRTALAAPKTVTLESIAQANGLSLGTSDDGAVFTAANNAIIAAAAPGRGLVVTLPDNTVEYTSVTLLGDNNGGYRCQTRGTCVVRQVRASSSAAVTWIFQINPADPYATNVELDGITFDGQWEYGRAPYASSPESDPWLDTQGCVNITNAFNGIDDAAYYANSTIYTQEPRNFIQDLVIANCGGDGLVITGAGSSNMHNIRGENFGGYGVNLQIYDSNFSDFDFGQVGRSGIYCHGNCAADRFVNFKAWYTGFRNISGSTYGLEEIGSSSNQWLNLTIQDNAGGCIYRDNTDLDFIAGACQWQGSISQLAPVSCVLTTLGSKDSKIDLVVSLLTHAGQTYYRVNKLICDGRSQVDTANTSYSTSNQIHIVTEGFTQDFNGYSSSWIVGPFDTTNELLINGIPRQSSQIAGDPATGQVNIGANVNNTLSGVIAFGPQSAYPGALSIVAANGQNGSLQSETSTGAFATATLTSTQNYANGETVQIGANVYTFKTTLTGAPYEVHIGATEAASLANLTNAVNALNPAVVNGCILPSVGSACSSGSGGTTLSVAQVYTGVLHVGDTVTCSDPVNCTSWVTTTVTAQTSATGPIASGNQGTYTLANSEPAIAYSNGFSIVSGVIGTDYGYGTSPSFQVSATNNATHTVTVTALTLGVPTPAIPVATTAAHASWSASTLTGGAADNQTYTTEVGWSPQGPVFNGFPLYTGVQPAYTGTCTTGSQKGAAAIGSFTATLACSAGGGTGTITLTWSALSFADGFACQMNDLTTPGDTWSQTAYTTNSASFSGSAAAGDHLTYVCARIP